MFITTKRHRHLMAVQRHEHELRYQMLDNNYKELDRTVGTLMTKIEGLRAENAKLKAARAKSNANLRGQKK